MFDSHKNFAYSTVLTAPSPAASGTSLVVQSGDGTKFPTVPFNATVWPAGADPITTNAEIIRVTNISTDTFTITRTQESTSARTIVAGDQIAATTTALTLTDIEDGISTGWIDETARTWTRTGNHTFTISGDVTSIYTIGTKVRYQDGGSNEYGVIKSSSYGAPNTTVTLVTNSDYAMAAASITANYISYAENPRGFPDWFNFATTWSGFSSDPTYVMKWSIKGRICHIIIESSGNGTSNATTLTFTIPIAAVISQTIGCVTGGDNNAALAEVGTVILSASSATAAAAPDAERTTNGWTASNGKSINCQFFYQI